MTSPPTSPSPPPSPGPFETGTSALDPGVPVDLAVVGAGPCGIAAGAAARRAGLSSLLIDRGPLCASLVRYPPYMSFFSTPEKLEIEDLPFVTVGRNPTRLEALTYYRRVTEYFGLPTRLYRDVVEIQGGDGDFRLHLRTPSGRGAGGGSGEESGEGEWVRARRVVVATGGFHGPNLLEIPGEELPKVRHHYTEAHPYWNQDVVVVGGGNSAVEASLELFRAGSRVTLVHFLEDFDRGVKPWILPDIRNRVEKGEIGIRWRHRVREIRPGSVLLEEESPSQSEEELPNDFVLALTGWKADPGLLRQVGVPVDEASGIPAHDPDTMETRVPGVFIAGVLAAGHDANRIFIENGRWHGRAIVAAVTRR
jgi:thioredoxin reductase (NADPH)